jgi:hypothetical protein
MLLCRIGAHLCRRLSDNSAYFSAIAGRSWGQPVLAPGKVRSNGRLGSTPAARSRFGERPLSAHKRQPSDHDPLDFVEAYLIAPTVIKLRRAS